MILPKSGRRIKEKTKLFWQVSKTETSSEAALMRTFVRLLSGPDEPGQPSVDGEALPPLKVFERDFEIVFEQSNVEIVRHA
jgi:hypothetical protein